MPIPPSSEIWSDVLFLELQSGLGDKPLKLQVVCPQDGTAVLNGLPKRIWGQTTQTPGSLSPKRGCGPTETHRTEKIVWYQVLQQ